MVGKFAQTFIDFPPQQTPASFNIDAVVNQVKGVIAKNAGNPVGYFNLPDEDTVVMGAHVEL